MSKNNKKFTWKAILAVVLVMATLFAMSSLVNAEFVEEILGEDYAEVMAALSSSSSSKEVTCSATSTYTYCSKNNCILGVTWSCGGCSVHQNRSFDNVCKCGG